MSDVCGSQACVALWACVCRVWCGVSCDTCIRVVCGVDAARLLLCLPDAVCRPFKVQVTTKSVFLVTNSTVY